MESWENKLLADKLNSLQDLPAGYSPNLSSKWEIIEAGLPSQEKRRLRPVILRWSVAAAVLLAISFTWLLKSKSEKQETAAIVQQSHVQSVLLPLSSTTVYNQNKLVIHQELPKKTLPVTVQKRIQPATQKNTETGVLNSQPNAVVLKSNQPQLTPSDTSVTSSNLEIVLATSIEKNKPAKKKIYQRDFNDGVLVIDDGFTPSNAQHFGIRLMPFSRKTDNGSEQFSRRLQLKTSL